MEDKFSVVFDGTVLEVSAVLADAAAVDRLVRALEANRELLRRRRSRNGQPPREE